MKICHVHQMRELDQKAISTYGIKQELLMENAGEAAYFALISEFGITNKSFCLLCGTGNNGGDGLVLARKLFSAGCRVTVFILGDQQRFSGSAALNYEIAVKLGINCKSVDKMTPVKTALHASDIIIDALFGTGLDREVKGFYRDVINEVNGCAKPVLSLDIPSGINGESAAVMGTAVRADICVTFGLPKLGNILYPGYKYGGKLFVTHISFPPELYQAAELKIALNMPQVLPPREPDSHKGTFGKVLFIAGSEQYLGAPYFAAQAFLKAGGGLSYLATSGSVTSFIGTKGSEIVFVPQKTTKSGSIALASRDDLVRFSTQCDMVVLGPGLSLDSDTRKLVTELVLHIDKPLLIDGDGLTALVDQTELLARRKGPTILTPHPGEMARLIGRTTEAVQEERIALLADKAEEWHSIIVLKGAHSLIAFPDKNLLINLSGNPGMATAGSGDVLTGIIAGMYGLGFDLAPAVGMGVFVHGLAGDIAATATGEDGLLAADILNSVPQALKSLRSSFADITKDYYHKIFLI